MNNVEITYPDNFKNLSLKTLKIYEQQPHHTRLSSSIVSRISNDLNWLSFLSLSLNVFF